jgi:hypothetical protein
MVAMKTTLEIPDDLFRRSKAEAALRGESLKDLVAAALQMFLERQPVSAPQGWRSVFGQARREETDSVDAVVAAELETVNPEEWR